MKTAPNVELYDWQKKVIESDEHLCLRCGRQTGKSTTIGIKSGEYAAHTPNEEILIISSVERQAYWIFEKVMAHLESNYSSKIKRGKDRPTKTKCEMKNGTRIRCLPTGLTGSGLRGPTINVLIADEAARIPEEVWVAVTPMLSTTEGQIILLSTPKGKGGYFYRSFLDKDFKNFHVTSEETPHVSNTFLEKESKRMTKMQYAQEYLAEFVDEICQFFPTDLIEKTCVGKRPEVIPRKNYLGMDIGRMGEGETTFEVFSMRDDKLVQVENIVKNDIRLTKTAQKTIDLTSSFHIKKIYMDAGGMGAGVLDILLEERDTRRKVVPLNNAKKSMDWKDEKGRRLLKEDMYHNLLRLMEQGKIRLLDDENLRLSLKSVQYDIRDDGTVQIFGDYDHITEGLIRAAWAIKDKGLNIYVK